MLKRQPDKIVKHFQIIRRLLATNWLSVFDHLEGLALKGITIFVFWKSLFANSHPSSSVRLSSIIPMNYVTTSFRHFHFRKNIFCTYTIITVFSISTRTCYPRSKYQLSLWGRCNDRGHFSRCRSGKQFLLYLLRAYVKNLETKIRKTKLLEFTWNTNKEE